MTLEIHIAGGQGQPIPTQVDFIKRAESMGFAGAGVADHLEHGQDAFVILALAATQTSNIALYPAVTNPKSRHPFHLAVMANTLAELAPGRAKLAMGTGDSIVVNLGTSPAKTEVFKDAVRTIRALLRGEKVQFGTNPDGRIEGPVDPPPPVVVTASGPRALRVAGEAGDEAMLLAGLSTEFRAQAGIRLAEGAAASGRDVASIPLMYTTAVAVDDDAEAARARVWPAVFSWTKMGFFNDGLKAVGLSVPEEERAEDVAPAVVKELTDHLALAGTPAYVIERFEQLRDEGVERVYCFAFGRGETRERVLSLLSKDVIGRT